VAAGGPAVPSTATAASHQPGKAIPLTAPAPTEQLRKEQNKAALSLLAAAE